jgi:hypothetical protein
MRVVSFVPSWTETLIEAGVNVVGRTRFCIHPESRIKNITVVGGTKNIEIDSVLSLNPDIILFDKEENNEEMYQLCIEKGLNCVATHVLSLKSCGEELIRLGQLLKNEQLQEWGRQYLSLKKVSPEKFNKCILRGEFSPNEHYQYVIWKHPYMVVSTKTFIGDMLKLFGIHVTASARKYPELTENELRSYFCLFSSEPFPFEKYYQEMLNGGYRGVVVDGEKLSWYGIRALKFLQ